MRSGPEPIETTANLLGKLHSRPWLEAVAGAFYLTVLITRLATVYSSNPPETEPTKGN
jgi:hypothetical protein